MALDWNSDNAEEGDYSIDVWATDPDSAIRITAEEMADHPDSGIVEDDVAGRQAFIDDHVRAAGPYAAVSVADGILNILQDIMSGPERSMSTQARADFDIIRSTLAQYGV